MTFLRQVQAEQLTRRQQLYLAKLRWHDKKVTVLYDGEQLVFRGPIIGQGEMPEDVRRDPPAVCDEIARGNQGRESSNPLARS